MKSPNPLLVLVALSLLVVAMLPSVLATSFIQECADDDWRTDNADVVLHGTVLSIDEKGFGESSRTEVTFRVDSAIKGDLSDEFVLVTPGHSGGSNQIPGMTLEWREGEQWRIDAQRTEASDFEAVPEGDFQLTCGVMSRTAIGESPKADGGEMCIQVITYAIDPDTESVTQFPTPCDVPESWEVIERPIPVEPDGGIGDGAVPDEEMCAQVITHARNPDGDIHMFPTPCDVPAGWEVVDGPIPVEPDGGIGDGAEPLPEASLWVRFAGWLKSLF